MLPATLRKHYPGTIALIALVIGAVFIWVRQDTPVTLNVFEGGRQAVIVVCTGIVIGGAMAELAAFVARTSPGETPVGSAVIAAIFALPCYAILILFGLMALD
jgi:hypothetical protein